MRTSYALLLRLIHDPGYDLSKASIEYLDRGASGDISLVKGEDIISLESGIMEIRSDLKTKFIPIHRIRRISYQGEPLWEKRDAENFGAKEKTAKEQTAGMTATPGTPYVP
ncbi:DUF504 domain-containing protein [Methanothrix sp.]|uniref:DUF504 domain-containing protein n=1 Tax=Methanothrix sp. TaxID=90426 RepID=UPI002352CF15|nr:DUF504 domain-containing protein [Methanothrix sp.]